ncbi:hypothetical protein T10_1332 [Trichinella papuae]|uniref:Uncharacterized protein n=1 Tax=Trichinella papuae TaxID=268474 RepID=A0A0V1MZK3_9BILA|nr:hypothetical protein T10_1332 [Trichinella papuae]
MELLLQCKWISGHFKPSFQSTPSPRFSQPTNSNWNHSTLTGTASLAMEYGSFSASLNILVVKGQRCSLLGRNWFELLGIRLC